MAQYKVIQDIEAEDKLFGPFSLRQFIYAAIALVCAFTAFRLAASAWYLAFPFLPPILFFGLLASPFSKDQPTEVWLLAKIRFFLKPQRRIWDQSGLKELVTITVPKKIERVLTKNFSQSEVRSRLEALANTIDSRGWAVKNANVNLFGQAAYAMNDASSDRLVNTATLSQEVPSNDVVAADDMFDERINPRAQELNRMVTASSQDHLRQAAATMQSSTAQPTSPAPDYWFMNAPPAKSNIPKDFATFGASPIVAPGGASIAPIGGMDESSPEALALLDKIHAEQAQTVPTYGHMLTLQPVSDQPKPTPQPAGPTPIARKAVPDTAILNLASDNDKTVATLGRQAKKDRPEESPGEVVISLR